MKWSGHQHCFKYFSSRRRQAYRILYYAKKFNRSFRRSTALKVQLLFSSGRLWRKSHFLLIVFLLEYTVIKWPGRMLSNAKKSIFVMINILLYLFILFSSLFRCCLLFYFTSLIFIVTFPLTFHTFILFFNQYPPILLMFTNIISFMFSCTPVPFSHFVQLFWR